MSEDYTYEAVSYQGVQELQAQLRQLQVDNAELRAKVAELQAWRDSFPMDALRQLTQSESELLSLQIVSDAYDTLSFWVEQQGVQGGGDEAAV